MTTNMEAVTVFNGITEVGTRRKAFYPTVIRNVSYVEAKGSTVANNGVWSEDIQYKIRIPLTSEIQEDRIYMSDLCYARLGNEETEKYWTIQKGDLVIRGEYSGKSPLYEDELAAYARELGTDLIRVTEYADNTAGGSLYLRHWRIGGK